MSYGAGVFTACLIIALFALFKVSSNRWVKLVSAFFASLFVGALSWAAESHSSIPGRIFYLIISGIFSIVIIKYSITDNKQQGKHPGVFNFYTYAFICNEIITDLVPKIIDITKTIASLEVLKSDLFPFLIWVLLSNTPISFLEEYVFRVMLFPAHDSFRFLPQLAKIA